MGLYGVLNSGVSGMNAQSNRLGVVADNIQNQNTVGYKRGSTQFSSLLTESGSGSYDSGSVTTVVRHDIGSKSNTTATTNASDIAIGGNGFFVVKDAGGKTALTRAGNFVIDAKTGDLVNAAGMHLQGYSLASGTPILSMNSFNGLAPVNLASFGMQAHPSTAGRIDAGNLNSNDPDLTGALSNTNFTKASSVITYDNLGNPFQVDLYFGKTATGKWQVLAYNHDTKTPIPPGGTATPLTFDTFGKLSNAASLSFTVPNGQPFKLDFANLTQMAGDFVLNGRVDGNKPQAVDHAAIDTDGTVYAVYQDGQTAAAFRIPLATVASPDNLTPRSGNVFEVTPESGDPQLNFANVGGRGSIESHSLEDSNVDLGNELATMIESQTGYGANSKVFQTGTEMLETLVNLKR
ncbi:flagellar hook protein FlgE [Methylobacterium sp. J-077]|uniref:flagellar hook protein FlgE n=1 Tax=Methylobacterium sp. J-077 TaxID=2836656 RepID=UPI001FBAEEDF|nr:flagellar hook protein FlgE [Methylobacterium sp. J-077]MCJ2122098.1 flagellar hook protein FlgE [Methylobacterium sp. J-077]